MLDGDPHPDPRGRVIHRREPHFGPQVDVREPLKELRRTSILDCGAPAHDEILTQARRPDRRAFKEIVTRGSRRTF